MLHPDQEPTFKKHMQEALHSALLFFFLRSYLFIHETEREREAETQAEGEACSRLCARSLIQDSISRPWDHTLS